MSNCITFTQPPPTRGMNRSLQHLAVKLQAPMTSDLLFYIDDGSERPFSTDDEFRHKRNSKPKTPRSSRKKPYRRQIQPRPIDDTPLSLDNAWRALKLFLFDAHSGLFPVTNAEFNRIQDYRDADSRGRDPMRCPIELWHPRNAKRSWIRQTIPDELYRARLHQLLCLWGYDGPMLKNNWEFANVLNGFLDRGKKVSVKGSKQSDDEELSSITDESEQADNEESDDEDIYPVRKFRAPPDGGFWDETKSMSSEEEAGDGAHLGLIDRIPHGYASDSGVVRYPEIHGWGTSFTRSRCLYSWKRSIYQDRGDGGENGYESSPYTLLGTEDRNMLEDTDSVDVTYYSATDSGRFNESERTDTTNSCTTDSQPVSMGS
ncbi:Protein of unknown function [Pyronema omphalodes CBS 100304]|uniref:Uncharacterized protein n=1 Tax=Pyronema omphalodes (strain CBS 100304) TaxID=1076935 RepID=U4LHM6_PYROM|nr:Protein of unknown function [Pyronema omphalodes CBS 100304]